MPISPESVTVAIEGWNANDLDSRKVFEGSMRSLASQTYPIDRCQVLILLDQEAATGDTGWLHSFLPDAQVVPVPGATYFRSKNSGLTQASREFIVFADSDVKYAPNWLESILECLDERPGVVGGNTQFEPGPFSRTLNLCDWAASRTASGWTDWFYGNNLAADRSLLLQYRFRDDLGTSGGGAVNILRGQLSADDVKIWFCAEAKGSHYLAPFWAKRPRVGAFQIRYRKAVPKTPWVWVVGVPPLSPILVTAGTMIKAWERAFRLRSGLPLSGSSLPIYLVSIAGVKIVELIGAAGYAWFPSWFNGRYHWFELPAVSPTASAPEGQSFPNPS